MHAFRRAAVALVLTLPLIGVAPLAAHADICGRSITLTDPPTTVYYPCPGPQDQPVGAPVWITTEYGPGYNLAEWQFVKVYEGGHIFLANTTWPTSVRFHGSGFDSGLVPQGSAHEVSGVPSLSIGHYNIYDENNVYVGDLYVEPLPRPCCA